MRIEVIYVLSLKEWLIPKRTFHLYSASVFEFDLEILRDPCRAQFFFSKSYQIRKYLLIFESCMEIVIKKLRVAVNALLQSIIADIILICIVAEIFNIKSRYRRTYQDRNFFLGEAKRYLPFNTFMIKAFGRLLRIV